MVSAEPCAFAIAVALLWQRVHPGAAIQSPGDEPESRWSERLVRIARSRCRPSSVSAGPGDVEAEARVRGEALGVHAVEDRDPGVDVVVELDVVFSLVGAQESPDVLHDSALERQGESEKQGVELGPVEALAQ